MIIAHICEEKYLHNYNFSLFFSRIYICMFFDSIFRYSISTSSSFFFFFLSTIFYIYST